MTNLLLTNEEINNNFTYPQEFLRIVEQNLLDFDPWIILQGERLRIRYQGLQDRYPNRLLIPFARREDNDDVACWEVGNDKIFIIHDYSTQGYENKKEIDNFWDWLREALEATIEYNDKN